MSLRSNLNKNGWNDSMHIFFSPKLSLEGKNMLPKLVQSNVYPRQQNFLTVFKKPITNIYDKISTRREKKAVCVIGESKEVEKRTQTTQHKKRNIVEQIEEQFLKNYRETITHQAQISVLSKNKRLSFNKIAPPNNKEKPFEEEFYYYIGPGNNAELVEAILSRRSKWVKTNSTLFHFRWEQARPKYQNSTIHRQLLNHLPNHEAISDKVSLVKNLKIYCEKNEEQLFKITPVCFELNFGDLDSCEVQIKRFIEFYWQNTEKISSRFNQSNSTNQSESRGFKNLEDSKKPIKKENISKNSKSFRNSNSSKKQANFGNGESSRRKEQIKQLHRTLLSRIKPYHNFLDMSTLKKEHPFSAPIHLDIYGETSLWLLKPADLNRGRGIHLFRTIEELGDFLQTELAKNQKSSFIVQKYIEKPMLITNRKFDIRVYAMVTQSKQLYFFKQGYIRTASTQFDINSRNYYTHLTNNAIQKYSKTYGEFEEGNILPLNYLCSEYGFSKKTLYGEIKKRIRICTLAGFSKMFMPSEKQVNISNSSMMFSAASAHNAHGSNNSKAKCFEIFGYDFMIDEAGNIWVIEVNTNPCLQLSNSWLKQIIPRMLDDAFKITLDRVFIKGREAIGNGWAVNGYENNENMWEYCELKNDNEMSNSSVL